MENNNQNTEELLLEIRKIEEMKNKKLMNAMWSILSISLVFYITILMLVVTLIPEETLGLIIALAATALFLIAGFISLKFELDAGYYECKKCHNKFVPKYKNVLMALHMGTTRYLKCPKCKSRSWAKKVMSK